MAGAGEIRGVRLYSTTPFKIATKTKRKKKRSKKERRLPLLQAHEEVVHNLCVEYSICTSAAMSWKIVLVLLIVFIAWAHQAFRPPPPRLCGSPGGAAIEAPRIKLREGRHLAYKEHGVPKKHSQIQDYLGSWLCFKQTRGASYYIGIDWKIGSILCLSIDRVMDRVIPTGKEPLKARLSISKNSVINYNLDLNFTLQDSPWEDRLFGAASSTSLTGILRLAGAALIAPAVNYWWHSFPLSLSTEVYYQQFPQDQCALRVAHHAPWLVYWWNTQKWFPASSIAAGTANFTGPDLKFVSKFDICNTTGSTRVPSP